MNSSADALFLYCTCPYMYLGGEILRRGAPQNGSGGKDANPGRARPKKPHVVDIEPMNPEDPPQIRPNHPQNPKNPQKPPFSRQAI